MENLNLLALRFCSSAAAETRSVGNVFCQSAKTRSAQGGEDENDVEDDNNDIDEDDDDCPSS